MDDQTRCGGISSGCFASGGTDRVKLTEKPNDVGTPFGCGCKPSGRQTFDTCSS